MTNSKKTIKQRKALQGQLEQIFEIAQSIKLEMETAPNRENGYKERSLGPDNGYVSYHKVMDCVSSVFWPKGSEEEYTITIEKGDDQDHSQEGPGFK